MAESSNPLVKLLAEDRRYHLNAYLFIFEALQYAQETLQMGQEPHPEDLEAEEPSHREQPSRGERAARGERLRSEQEEATERHVTGQQLCEAIRRYALKQFGLMARCVLGQWGIKSTSDFGEIVYNLIRIKQMRKTRSDRREDFDNVFDFQTGFDEGFKIQLADPPPRERRPKP